MLQSFFRPSIAAAVLLAAAPAFAAENAANFPARTVRWIVPYPSGDSIDIIGRTLAVRLAHAWTRQVIVDNQPGAGGREGVRAVIGAPPDGHTQLMAFDTDYTVARSARFEPQKSLAPVAIVASTPLVLISSLALPARNLKELVALAKRRPGAVDYGSSGAGSSLHLAMALFNARTGVEMKHAAYDGGASAAVELIAGQVQAMFIHLPTGLPYVKAGNVRTLGISTARRSPRLPEVPTLSELGVAGFDVAAWYGVAVPAGTPAPVIAKTHADVARVLSEPQVRSQLTGYGVDTENIAPDGMAKRIREEAALWAKTMRESSIRLD